MQKTTFIEPNTTLFVIGFCLFIALVIFFVPNKSPAYKAPATISLRKINDEKLVRPIFLDKTLQKGIVTEHRQRSDHLIGLSEAIGGGACALDYNDDGWMDLFIVGGSGIGHYYGHQQWWQSETGSVLYRNVEGRYFEPDEQAFPEAKEWGMRCSAADFDNDGDTDLFLSNYGENRLLENIGGVFSEVPSTSHHDDNQWTTASIPGDFDNDGLIDLYIINYVDYAPDRRYLEQSAAFSGPSQSLFNPALFEPQNNQLLRNLGEMKFENVTEISGVADRAGRGLNGQWVDINGDDILDIVVSNDIGSPNKVFIQSETGTFEDSARLFGLGSAEAAHDIVVQSIMGSAVPEILIGGNSTSSFSVLSNEEKRGYREIGSLIGIDPYPESNWDIKVADFNDDGLPDIYLTNGLARPDMDSISHSQAQANRLLLKHSNGAYTDCSDLCFPESLMPISNRHTLVADFDNDGDLDIFESANNDLGRYLENQLVNNNHSETNQSNIALESAAGKLAVTKWLMEDDRFDEAVYELSSLSHHQDTNIAIQSISALSFLRHSAVVSPLISALKDSRPEVRVVAINSLVVQEVDFTGRYLTPMLEDSNEDVRCAAAKAFSYFYDEEEAMIRSKLRTKPVLARIAESVEFSLPCILETLGKSESYRALSPLLHLASNGTEKQKISAVQSLGLIKEKEAMPFLQSIVEKQDSSSDLHTAAIGALNQLEPGNPNSRQASLDTSSPVILKQSLSGDTQLTTEETEAELLGETYRQADSDQRRRLLARAADSNEPIWAREAILDSFFPEILLSEYRVALEIAQNISDPLRYRVSNILLAYAPEKHAQALISELHSGTLSDDHTLALAKALRPTAAEAVWEALLKEPKAND